jgi:hypothetical protein
MGGMWDNWRDGGWGMWPILAFGILAILGAARFAWRGEHGLTGFVRWMALTTASSAVLGFCIGMHKVLDVAIGHDPRFEPPTSPVELTDFRFRILFEGTKEASNCLSFGLILLTLTCLLLAIGYRRFPTPEAA